MRTMVQVWIMVAVPFVGLVLMSSLVIALLGVGNYRYHSDPEESAFRPTNCSILDGCIRPFDQFKSEYSENCSPTILKCYEVVWNVSYNNTITTTTGIIYSSGVSASGAKSLMDLYKINSSYQCFHLRGTVSWTDWTPTDKDLRIDVKLMLVGGSLVASFSLILLVLALCYIRIGYQQWPFVFETNTNSGYERLS